MPPLTGRLSLSLTVRHVGLSAEWYRAVFAMEEYRRFVTPDGHVGEVCLREPGTGLELCLLDHEANPGDPFSEFRTGLDHLEFLVANLSDLEGWVDHLDELGIAH